MRLPVSARDDAASHMDADRLRFRDDVEPVRVGHHPGPQVDRILERLKLAKRAQDKIRQDGFRIDDPKTDRLLSFTHNLMQIGWFLFVEFDLVRTEAPTLGIGVHTWVAVAEAFLAMCRSLGQHYGL